MNSLLKRHIPAVLPLLFLALSSQLAAHTFALGRESGKKIMEMRNEKHRIDSEIALITLTVIGTGGEVQVREILAATRRNDFGRFDYLIRFLGPEEIAGTSLLSREAESGEIDQFLYLPALGMVNRITGEAQRASFMGSDFTYEDLKKESTADYEYAYVGDARIGTRLVHKVVAVASTPGNRRITGYARRILYIDAENLHILKVEFFDPSNVHEKTLEAFAFGSEEVEGEAIRPHRAVMSNHLRGTTSVMTLRRSRLDEPLDSRFFTRDTLRKFDDEDRAKLMGSWMD